MMPPPGRSKHRRDHAFTLVEVLIVLVIIGILAVIAYPNVASHLVKGKRAGAQAALLEMMQMQEQYFTEHNTYLAFSADAPDPLAQRFRWFSGSSAAASAYELRGQACTGHTIERCIELRAEPGTGRVDATFRDPDCGTLSMRSDGEQGASGPAEGCWP